MSKGVDESKIEDLLKSFGKGKKDEERSKTKEKERIGTILAKYFFNGFAFSLLSTVLIIL